jgi:hypothetical protein
MDPKRNNSEFFRTAKAPFGEEVEKENIEEEYFETKTRQLRKFSEDLEKIETFNKEKKILNE